MSNDNNTLADAQPDGMVRLGDQTFAQGCDELRMRTEGERTAYLEGVAEGRNSALSAQPPPGGQDALAALQQDYNKLLDSFDRQVEVAEKIAGRVLQQDDRIEELEAALAARQPVGEPVVYGVRVKGTSAIVGVLPVKLKDFPVKNTEWDERYEEVPLYAAPPAQAVDPSDPWRGLYSPDLMPKLDGTNQYHVAHPDLPEWPKAEDEERGIGPLITAQGFAMAVVFGEYPDEEAEEVDYCAWLASWTPDTPDGIGWRLVCIQDSEDGPAAFFVRPLSLIDSQGAR